MVNWPTFSKRRIPMIYHFVVEVFETDRAKNQTKLDTRQSIQQKGSKSSNYAMASGAKDNIAKCNGDLIFQNGALFLVAGIPHGWGGEKDSRDSVCVSLGLHF